jgi:hypothetical protein
MVDFAVPANLAKRHSQLYTRRVKKFILECPDIGDDLAFVVKPEAALTKTETGEPPF